MVFPATDRVLYDLNTLEEVKCQIRFPPILAIDASPPASFQELVRNLFPFFEVKSSVKLPAGFPTGIAQMLERDISLGSAKSYAFLSEDRTATVSLARDTLSLASRHYERWEQFRELWRCVLQSLVTSYRPTFFTHTCLRYKNAVRRQPLGLLGIPWSQLLNPCISGPLGEPGTVDRVEALQHRWVMGVANSGMKVEAKFELGIHQPSQETAFIIEAHVFDDSRKEMANVPNCLDSLHQQAANFFRWCITDELHGAMRPHSL